MNKISECAFVWLVGVATVLAIPAYRGEVNLAQAIKNEDSRLVETHNRLNTAIDKIGSGVADAGAGVSKVGNTLTNEETGTLPLLATTVYGLAASIASPRGSIHRHIDNLDDYLRAVEGGVLEAAGSVQNTAEHTTQLEDAATGEIPALGEHFGRLSASGETLMQAWTLAGSSVSDHLPLLLKDVDKTVRIAGFIGKDVHEYTFAAVHPKHWYQEPGIYGKVGLLACRLLCPSL